MKLRHDPAKCLRRPINAVEMTVTVIENLFAPSIIFVHAKIHRRFSHHSILSLFWTDARRDHAQRPIF